MHYKNKKSSVASIFKSIIFGPVCWHYHFDKISYYHRNIRNYKKNNNNQMTNTKYLVNSLI